MERTIEYVQVTANFNSAYNIPLNPIQLPTYIPLSSSFASSTLSNRPSSPLFHRCKSPPPRIPSSTGSAPKFNFDLYKTNNDKYEFDRDSLSSYRSPSPPSTRRIYHHPIHSPVSSPLSNSPPLSKLRQINDELCQTLARSELTSRSPVHYHVHHYPLSQYPPKKHRSRSTSEERASSTVYEVSPNIHKARITYKVHIPRRYRKSSRDAPISDIYSSDDPTIIDLYPTRDHGFVKQTRKKTDYQSPWVVKGTSIRRGSNSDTNTSQLSTTPRESYYDNKSTKARRRSTRESDRPSSAAQHRSSHATSRSRPDSAPFDISEQNYESNGSNRRSKNVGARIPSSKSKQSSGKRHKRAEHNAQSEDSITTERSIDESQLEQKSGRKTSTNQTEVHTGDSRYKKRIENKGKSTPETTVNDLSKPIVKDIKPPKTTTTDENSIVDESTSRSPSMIDKHANSTHHDSFVQESTETERSNNQESPRSPIHTGKQPVVQQIQSPSSEIVKTTTNDASIHTNNANGIHERNQTPSPPPDVKQSKSNDDNKENEELSNNQHIQRTKSPIISPKIPNSEPKTTPQKVNEDNKNKSISNDDTDEADQEVSHSFDINKFLSDATKSIFGPPKTGDTSNPSAPVPQIHPKPTSNSSVHRQNEPPSRDAESDDDVYNPPFGPKRNNTTTDNPPSARSSSSASPPPPPAIGPTNPSDDADDFFS